VAAGDNGRFGGRLIAVGALLGLGVSIYNFFAPVSLFAPASTIAGTPGAILVIVSTALLLLAGLVLASRVRSAAVRWFFGIAALLDIIGTTFAAYLLDSTVLMALMGVCGVGWIAWIGAGRDRPAPATAHS
jgi:hypothetical protein